MRKKKVHIRTFELWDERRIGITWFWLDGDFPEDRIALRYEMYFFVADYCQEGERNGHVFTVQAIDHLKTLQATTLAEALKNYLSSIPIGSKILFDTYDEVLPESIAYHEVLSEKNRKIWKEKQNQ